MFLLSKIFFGKLKIGECIGVNGVNESSRLINLMNHLDKSDK